MQFSMFILICGEIVLIVLDVCWQSSSKRQRREDAGLDPDSLPDPSGERRSGAGADRLGSERAVALAPAGGAAGAGPFRPAVVSEGDGPAVAVHVSVVSAANEDQVVQHRRPERPRGDVVGVELAPVRRTP
jgi:hypothetical protein